MLVLGAIVGVAAPFLTHLPGAHGHGVANGAAPPVAHASARR